MSSQTFSVQVREAIWEAHGNKCLYCTRSLLFSDLVIDHVIPEATTIEELGAIVERIGLDPKFSIFGWENHAPCCYGCNKHKLAHPYHDGYLSITLRKIEAKLRTVRELVLKAKQAWDLDKVLRTIARGVEDGKYSHEELEKRIEIMRRFPHGISGAGGRLPPASPEEKAMGIKFSGPRITMKISPEAAARLKAAGLSYAEVAKRIERSVTAHTFHVQALPKTNITVGQLQAYMMRIGQEARMKIELSNDTVEIKEFAPLSIGRPEWG